MAVWLTVKVAPSAEPVKKEFDLPAEVAARSLKQFARQSGVQVLISADLGRETHTRSVKGLFTPREALDRMLAETGLTVKEDTKNGTMAVLPSPRPNDSLDTPNSPERTSNQATWKT